MYTKPNIRPSTAGYYRRAMEEYTIPRIGSVKLNKLTSREIQKLYKDLLENGRLRKKQRKKRPGLSGSTARGVHIMLHSALDRAVKERLLICNPADSCVVPNVQHQEMKTLQPEDLKAYLDASERRNALAMFYLELVSCIRKGELVARWWEYLNVAEKTIPVSKQASKDADNPWLFPSSRTGAMYHPAEAGRGSANHGQSHGAGEIKVPPVSSTAPRLGSRTSLPVRCVFCAV